MYQNMSLRHSICHGNSGLILDKKFFKFVTTTDCYQTNFGIFIDISDTNFNNITLYLLFCKEENASFMITLHQVDNEGSNTVILSFTINDGTNTIFQDLLEKLDFDKSCLTTHQQLKVEQCDVQMSMKSPNQYSLSLANNLIDVKFEIHREEKFVYSLISNPEANIVAAKNMLYQSFYVKDGAFINDVLVDSNKRFMDYDINHSFVISIVEKCYMINKYSNETVAILPWDYDCFVMCAKLALNLNIDLDGIRLFNEKGEILHDHIRLDIYKFRSLQERYLEPTKSIQFFYQVSSAELSLTSMQESFPSIVTKIPDECLVCELKQRLSKKLAIDKFRILLFGNEKILKENDPVSTEHKVIYLIASKADSGMQYVNQGSFGKIYKYTTSSESIPIALKEFRFQEDEITFLREFIVLSSITSHTNIVQYIDIFTNEKSYFIGMEYISGGSLHHLLDNNGALKYDQIREYTYHILLGLKHLHDNKIIHRDIKGDNVLLGDNNIAKLCDFGLSKVLTNCNTRQLSEGITLSAECGTSRWMAPEVINGGHYAVKADIWSVGATVVEMITGEVPYCKYESVVAFFVISTTKKIEFTTPEPMPADLQMFVELCLKPSPTDRPKVTGLLQSAFMMSRQNASG